MWCSNCQQDVPAIATPDDSKVRCTKCREEIAARAVERADQSKLPASRVEPVPAETPAKPVPEWAFVERPPLDFDSWRWDEDLFEAERLLQVYKSSSHPAANSVALSRAHRTDLPRPLTAESARARGRQRSPLAIVAWAMLSIGVMAVVFGGALLGWSAWSGNQQLWTIGLPFAIGGQAALVLGLVLQLDGVSQSNGDATTALQVVENQIDELRQTTVMLASNSSDPSHSFYSHLSEGSSPNFWLHGLKGQLDALERRLAKES